MAELQNEHGPQALSGVGQAEPGTLDRLLPLAYDELRRIAQDCLGGERPGHTLDATALVHEAYLKLVGQQDVHWQNRAHLLGVAAQAIRRILVDHARGKARDKRGGRFRRVTLSGVGSSAAPELDLLDLDDALERLAAIDERDARIVEMRYFAGLSLDEIAATFGISERTVRRQWNYAKTWLFRELSAP